jgi:hypothetical protein
MFVPLSVLEFRDRAATFFGDKIGVVDGEEQFTYRAFATRTHRLANALVERSGPYRIRYGSRPVLVDRLDTQLQRFGRRKNEAKGAGERAVVGLHDALQCCARGTRLS